MQTVVKMKSVLLFAVSEHQQQIQFIDVTSDQQIM